MGIIDALRSKWRFGSMLMRIVMVNVAVTLLLHLLTLIFYFTPLDQGEVLEWVEFPSAVSLWLRRPWTIITYMFVQFDLLHLLFNMLWLYWFAAVFLLADSARRLLALYIYGGIGGALLFMGAYNLSGHFGLLIGSSASVLAIVVATAMRHPDYKVGLMFIGEVSLKWIAIITIAIDFISIGGSNTGGHVAHIGGAIVGLIYALTERRGFDITKPFCRIGDAIANLFHRRPRPAKSAEAELDDILAKVKRSGYGSLSAAEKAKLFDISRHIRR